MTTDQLKAELAQLAEENRRLREVLSPFAWLSEAFQESDPSFRQVAAVFKLPEPIRKPGKTEYARALNAKPFLDARDTLQTPPTPGIGAAMLRVVEAAKRQFDRCDEYREEKSVSRYKQREDAYIKACLETNETVQALNELEAKKGERDVEV